MKKFFAWALGALLAASAGPALAASPVEFEGYVKVFHESLSNFTRGDGGGRGAGNPGNLIDRDNFFSNKLQINVTFRPTDQVSVHWQFRGPNYQRWGVQPNPWMQNNLAHGDPYYRDNVNVYTRALYGEAVFPWGTIRGGRIVEGLAGTAGGLASLGYNPSWGSEFLYLNPFDGGDPVDGLTYTNKWDNGFGLAVYYTKPQSYFGNGANNYPFGNTFTFIGQGNLREFRDNDYDVFGVEGSYEWEGGGATLGVSYHRDMTDPFVEKNYAFYINPAIYQSWGPFAIHFEAQMAWGRTAYSREFIDPADWPANWSGVDRSEGLGLYLDGVYNYGSGDVTLATWFVDGTNFGTGVNALRSGKNHDLVNLGDFSPFLVAHNSVTLGNGIHSNSFGWHVYDDLAAGAIGGVVGAGDPSGLLNQWGIAILGNHQITPEIKLNYGIGYFRLVHPNVAWYSHTVGTTQYWVEQSKDLGWEIDVGATFQILDNLSFETQFGYMFNGKAYDVPIRNAAGTMIGMEKAKDTFAWANVLSFTF